MPTDERQLPVIDETKPVSELGYEECRDELTAVVQALEHGGLDLNTSLNLWERGEKLARRCEEHLAGARQRVEQALAGEKAPGSEPDD